MLRQNVILRLSWCRQQRLLVLALPFILAACGGESSSRSAAGADSPDARSDEPVSDVQSSDTSELEPDVVAPPAPVADTTVSVGAFRVEVIGAAGQVRVLGEDGELLFETLSGDEVGEDASQDRLGGYAPLATRETSVSVQTIAGSFAFEREGGDWSQRDVVTEVRDLPDGVELVWAAAGAAPLTMRLIEDARGHLDVTVVGDAASEPGLTTLTSMTLRCAPDERFYGLGSQSYGVEHRGWRVPMWPREQGVGRSEGGGVFGLNGRLEDAYAPMGWLMSSRGYGLLIGRSERSVFEVCSERDDAWRLETFADVLRFKVLRADGPKALLTAMTEMTGRMTRPAPWTFGPWNDSLRSPERAMALLTRLRDYEVPTAAIWVEDWIGGEDEGDVLGYHLTYTWIWDEARWPDLPGLIDEMEALGVHFLGYFNSFIRKESALWPEAIEGGYLIETPDGEPYEFIDPIFEPASLLDLTNPEAVAWLRDYQLTAASLGMRGWMVDFAEWMPYDAVLADGRTGAEVHNLYPLMWQQANRDHLEEAFPDGNFTYFARSGFAWTEGGTSGLAPVVWAGDQNTDWSPGDGIKTVVPIGINLGMSGVGVFTHDVGGYASAVNPPTSRELWFRWTELGAFTPVMRTHHGAKDTDNWMLDRDEGSTLHWKRYAIEHSRLYPYFMAAAMESSRTGVPIFRHTILEFPDDPEAPTLMDQYMLGASLLVAPVLDEGATSRSVYLPAGRWADWWTGQLFEGPARHTIDAPLGTIPVFLREGGLVARLRRAPDTFIEGADDALVSLADLGADLEVRLLTGAEGAARLDDDTTLSLDAAPLPERWAEHVTLEGDNPEQAPLPACDAPEDLDCVDAEAGLVRVSGAALSLRLGIDGPTLRVEGPPRAWRFEIW